MFRTTIARKLFAPPVLSVVIVASLIGVGLLHSSLAFGDQLPDRSVTLDNAVPNSTDTYRFAFSLPNSEQLGSIRIQLCSDSPLIDTTCVAPNGSDLRSAVLSNQAGATGFTIQSVTANTIILGRTLTTAAAGQYAYELSSVKNPSTEGTFYARIQTYTDSTASGSATDYGGLAFAINKQVQISTVVPPYLYFCVGITVTGTDCTTATGNYINFGDFSTAVASVAQTQMVAGTNAEHGYAITANGITLTSGTNEIPALTAPNTSRPGSSQFGMNLVANQDPQVGKSPAGNGQGQPTAGYNQANLYKFIPGGDTVVAVPQPDEPRNYTTSYIANIAKTQAAGVYVSTITYICTGTF